MIIVFLQTLHELAWWNSQPEFQRGDVVIATSSTEVGYQLNKLNIRFFLLWSYISESQIEANWITANDHGENWVSYSGVKFTNISTEIAKLAGRDMIMMFQAALNSYSYLSNFLDTFGCIDKVILFKKEGPALLRTGPHPTKDAVDLIEIAVLRFLLDDLKIRYELVESCGVDSRKKKKSVIDYKHIRHQIFNYLKSKPVETNKDDKPIVVIYNSLLSKEECAESIAAIQDIGCYPVVINESSLVGSRGIGDLYSFNLSYHGQKYPFIYANKYLEYYFDQVSVELVYSLELARNFSEVCKVINSNIVMFGHDSFTRERVLCRQCKLMNIDTISIGHAGISHDFAMINYFLGDAKYKLVCTGWHADLLVSYLEYSNTVNFYTLGSLNHLKYRDEAKDVSEKSAIKKIKVLLLTANITTGASTPFGNPVVHLETLDQIKKQLSSNEFNVIIKSHPSFDSYSIYDAIALECVNFKHVKDGNLDNLIDWCDVVVLVNYPTSASIIALLSGRPLVYINCAEYNLALWHCSLLKDKANFVRNINKLREQILISIATNQSRITETLIDILGYKHNPREKFREILQGLIFSHPKNKQQEICISSKQIFPTKLWILLYGVTGKSRYLSMIDRRSRYTFTSIETKSYLEGAISNLSTRQISWREMIWLLPRLLGSYLLGLVSFSIFFKVLLIHLLVLLKNLYCINIFRRIN